MGWNHLQVKPGSALFQGIDSEPFVYFAHSYYLPSEEASATAAARPSTDSIVAAVVEQNIAASSSTRKVRRNRLQMQEFCQSC